VAFFNLSNKSSLENFDAAVKGASWGYQAGLGIDLLKKLTFDARYEGSLSDFSNDITLPDGTALTPTTKTSAFLLSLGFMF
jgi:opacity protein-like surface antigen